MNAINTPIGFTYSIFPQDYGQIEDFIWGYLFAGGFQYYPPYSNLATKEIVLIYEEK